MAVLLARSLSSEEQGTRGGRASAGPLGVDRAGLLTAWDAGCCGRVQGKHRVAWGSDLILVLLEQQVHRAAQAHAQNSRGRGGGH